MEIKEATIPKTYQKYNQNASVYMQAMREKGGGGQI